MIREEQKWGSNYYQVKTKSDAKYDIVAQKSSPQGNRKPVLMREKVVHWSVHKTIPDGTMQIGRGVGDALDADLFTQSPEASSAKTSPCSPLGIPGGYHLPSHRYSPVCLTGIALWTRLVIQIGFSCKVGNSQRSCPTFNGHLARTLVEFVQSSAAPNVAREKERVKWLSFLRYSGIYKYTA